MQKSNKASSDDHIPARKSQRTQWRVTDMNQFSIQKNKKDD